MELPSFYRSFYRILLRSISCKTRSVLVAGVIWFFSSAHASASTVYTPLQLKQDVAQFLAKIYSATPHERIEINVSNLDSRLRLIRCEPSPKFTLQDSTGNGGNISVKAECESGKKWSVHVPAQANIYRQIPVAQGNIARGELINHAHIGLNLVNISSIRQAFLVTADDIIGKEAKRNISQGEPFKTAILSEPTVVKRGELVSLESLAGSIKVSSTGTAMADGRVGQKIKVRNNSSERIISGVVVSRGIIQTL